MHGCPLHTIFRLAGRQPPRRVAARRCASVPGEAPCTVASDAATAAVAERISIPVTRPGADDGAAAYTGDSAPRSRLATLSLCTTTPLPGSCLAVQARTGHCRSRAPLCVINRPLVRC